jgi:sortase A
MRGSPARGGQRWRGVLRSAERLLVVAGIAILAWCAVVVADASLAQRAARRSLEAMARVTPAPPRALPTSAVVQQPRAIRGGPIAALSIPRIDLSVIVLHGSDDTTLRRGPGHLEGTPMPGDAGNVVFAGHRDSFFRPLRRVRTGDDVFVDTPHGRFHYRVSSLRVVHSRDLSVLEPTGDDVLTLITCYPFSLLGSAPERFIVRAVRVTAAGSSIASEPPAPAREAEPARGPLRTARGDGPDAAARPAPDDGTLVRQAIERFRLAHNARLIRRKDDRPAGLLKFQACNVIVDGDQAVADCTASGDDESRVWTSTLRRTAGGWAISRVEIPADSSQPSN